MNQKNNLIKKEKTMKRKSFIAILAIAMVLVLSLSVLTA